MNHGDTPGTRLRLFSAERAHTEARRRLRDDPAVRALARGVRMDAEIVMGELVMNACEHGSPDSDGTIEVAWWISSERLHISVADSGETAHLSPVAFEQDSERGRGLHMVDVVSDRWHQDHAHGTRITVELLID